MKTINGMLRNSSKVIFCFILFFELFSCQTNNSRRYYEKSIAELNSKDYNKAIEYINKAIVLDSTFAEAYFIRCQILDLLGAEKSLVCKDLQKAAKLGYEKAILSYNQNCIQKPIETYGSLSREFEEYIEKNPNRFEGYYDLGNLNFDYGFYDKAILNYTIVIEIKIYPVAYYNRGLCYFKLNQKEKACNDIRKAIDLGYEKAKEALSFCE